MENKKRVKRVKLGGKTRPASGKVRRVNDV